MRLRKIISLALSAALMSGIGAVPVSADELYSETVDMTGVKPQGDDGVILERELENGDYTVTVTTGGDTETSANIYINGGERVRLYKLEAGDEQKNPQPVVVTDGKLKVQVLGENPNVTEIEIKEIPKRVEKGEKPTLYIAGDSTAQTYDYTSAYPQTGWGQVFDEFFTDDIIIDNRSMGGRSTLRFDNDGRLDAILTAMKPGDYLFIQFGINDGDQSKPERYISVEDYKKMLADKYIGETVKRGGIPVLMTPTSAAWWDEENNKFMESRQDYADPTRELAKELGCKFIDANRIITDSWNSMNKDEVLSGYFICEPLESKAYPTGTNDTTHLKEKGAKRIAKLIADAIPNDVPELAKYLKPAETFADISGHWAEDTIKRLADEGIVEGSGTGYFYPETAVTYAEFLKMVMEAAGVPGHAYREGECFEGTLESHWYSYYLQGALDKGMIPLRMTVDPAITDEEAAAYEPKKVEKVLAEATEDSEAVTTEIYEYAVGGFYGNKPITRGEMAALTVNALKVTDKASAPDIPAYNGPWTSPFTDITESPYEDEINAATFMHLLNGMDETTFAPNEPLTRAQAAAVIGRLLP